MPRSLRRLRLPGRKGKRRAPATFLAAGLLTAGCSHVGAPGPAVTQPGEEASRCLFRVRFSDGERDGRFRLVLWEDAAGFRLVASDPLGRDLWAYDRDGSSGLWIDRRQETLCRLRGEVAIEVEEFGSVPARVLPDLLHGRRQRLPPDLLPEDAGDAMRLARGEVVVSWTRSHCEASDVPRPSLERFFDWPQNCAVSAGSGE